MKISKLYTCNNTQLKLKSCTIHGVTLHAIQECEILCVFYYNSGNKVSNKKKTRGFYLKSHNNEYCTFKSGKIDAILYMKGININGTPAAFG